MNLILTMLNSDIFCFENSVDPDQLASKKPAEQDSYCLTQFSILLLESCKLIG